MIKSILRKDTKIVLKLDCLEQIEELRRKKLSISALMREYAIINEVERWDLSPVPVLCETYVYISRMNDILSKWYMKFYEKNQIRITTEEQLIYETYCNSLITFASEMKHIYGINLVPEKNLS